MARFWVGGTGSWNDTAHWSTTSGGSGGSSVPTSSDPVTFDSSSGGGTCTVNVASPAMNGLTLSSYTGTLDFANGSPAPTSITSPTFTDSGTGIHSLLLGAVTWSITSPSANIWNASNTNLTLNAGTSTITFAGSHTASQTVTFASGQTYYNLILGPNTDASTAYINDSTAITGTSWTCNNLTINNQCKPVFTNSATITINGTMTCTGTSTNPCFIQGNTTTTGTSGNPVFTLGGTSSGTWTILLGGFTFASNTITFNNSFGSNLNSGTLVINPPSTTSGGGLIIG